MLRLSRRIEYSLLLLGQLAKTDSCLSLSQLAQSHHLSVKFLEQVAAKLKSAKIVSAKTGSGGGYLLAAPPKSISLDQIITAIEGDWHLADCLAKSRCTFLSRCQHHPILKIAETHLRQVFAKYSVADLTSHESL